jgi:hypothetical protein
MLIPELEISNQNTEVQIKSETPNLMNELINKFDNLMKGYEIP